MKLEEGLSYIFSVAKKINFEGKEYFVLQAPDRRRFMVPTERYKDYNIEKGSEIRCRIDKINCKGEVFLEPEHPYYKIGAIFQFQLSGRDVRVDRAGEKHNVFIVLDKYKREIPVPENLFGDRVPEFGSMVDLCVSQIIKGKISFDKDDTELRSEKNEEDTIYEFFILEELRGFDGRSYFLVSTDNLDRYTVPCDYYRHYGLATGKKFKGRFIRYKTGEEVRIEPLNPFFIPGNSYTFKVLEILNHTTNRGCITVLSDQYGFNHHFDGDPGLSPGSELILTVERIRKGWPLLK